MWSSCWAPLSYIDLDIRSLTAAFTPMRFHVSFSHSFLLSRPGSPRPRVRPKWTRSSLGRIPPAAAVQSIVTLFSRLLYQEGRSPQYLAATSQLPVARCPLCICLHFSTFLCIVLLLFLLSWLFRPCFVSMARWFINSGLIPPGAPLQIGNPRLETFPVFVRNYVRN